MQTIFFRMLPALLLTGVLLAAPVSAKIFKYIDDNGVVHYTDTMSTIPPEYRQQIQQYREAKNTKSSQETDAADQGQTPAPAASEKNRDADMPPAAENTEKAEKAQTEAIEIPKTEETAEQRKQLEQKRKQLQKKQQKLDNHYQSLLEERKQLRQRQDKLESPDEINAHNQKVDQLNQKIESYRQKRQSLESDVKAFNDMLQNNNPQQSP